MGIERSIGDNLGGLAQVWIARRARLSSFFANNTLSITKEQLQALFEELPFKTGDAYPSRDTSEDAHGPYRQLKLLIQLDKQSPETDQVLEPLEGREVVVVALDHHGRYLLFGQPDSPLTFTSDLDYGAQPPEGQKYNLTFTGRLPLKTPSISVS